MPSKEETEFWQCLLAAETSPIKSRDLIKDLGSSLFGYKNAFLSSPILNIGEKKKVGICNPDAASQELASGTHLLIEDEYPETLRQVHDFTSPALFVKGNLASLEGPTVGIVGTRNASPYATACAHKFAEALAREGVTIVSGGALGIDAAAHRGALAAEGSSVAVIAGGIDSVYPAIHAPLFTQLQQRGCIVSQFAVGSPPLDYKFLARNVTIAALSQVLLVVQAPTRSGSLSTAHAAAEMGREVFVIPANIDAPHFQGSFNLLRDGATLVYHPHQILDSMGLKSKPAQPAVKTSDVGKEILRVLSLHPMDTDKISERTGLSAGEILTELTMLELDGEILRESGGYVLRK